MLVIYSIIGGALLGVGGTLYVKRSKEPVVIEQPEPVVITESKVAEKLTNIDLLKIPCSSDYIKDNGDLLCREMFCLMQTRGVDAKVSGSDCSAISNVQNTLVILETCRGEEGLDDRCIQIYRERK
jgi:hypothetical protein|tara:strand:- start:35 stop:412 length:378 start_codon:yes stop_codon:yes gene_type:complete